MERKPHHRPFTVSLRRGGPHLLVGRWLAYEGSSPLAVLAASIRVAYGEWKVERDERVLVGARITYWPQLFTWLKEQKELEGLRGKFNLVIPPEPDEGGYRITVALGEVEAYDSLLSSLKGVLEEGRVLPKECLICSTRHPKHMTRHHITPRFAFNSLRRELDEADRMLARVEGLTLVPLCRECHNHRTPYSLEGLTALLEGHYGSFTTLDSIVLLIHVAEMERALLALGLEMVEELKERGEVNVKRVRERHVRAKLCREALYNRFLGQLQGGDGGDGRG